MKEVVITSKVVGREGAGVPAKIGQGSTVDLSAYLLKAIWDKVWEIRTDSTGQEYIFGKLPVVTQYGITMYAGDGVDVPSLASGLPFDGRTIWYNPDTQQIEVIGGTGGGSGEGVSNFWDLSGIPSWITNSKPNYSYSEIEGTPDLTQYALVSQIPSLSGYATESWVLQKNYATKATTLSGYGITDAYTKTNVDDLLKAYVTLSGSQTITGEKNFTGGLKVNGSPIYYDTEKKYWKLEGDLLVTGGVTMYGSDSSFVPSTIMDAIAVDGTTISKDGGVLKVIGGTGGGVADSVAWANITGKPTWIGSSKPSYSYSEITGAISTTELQNYLTQNSYLDVTSGDNRYLKLSGGTLSSNSRSPLTLKSGSSENHSLLLFNRGSDYWGSIGFNAANSLIFKDTNGANYIIWNGSNFNPSNYLPLSGGTLTGNILLGGTTTNKIGTNIVDATSGYQEFTHQNSHGYIAIGPFNDGFAHIYTDRPSFYFNKDLYVNNAKVWNSSNDGSGSGLDADLLDGKHNGELTASMLLSGAGSVLDANETNFSDYALRFFNSIPSTSTNFPTFTGYQNGLLALPLHSNGATAQLYFTIGKNPYYRSHHTYEWNEIAYKTDNVSSATKLQTARTIWGQSFDGTGNIDGHMLLKGQYVEITLQGTNTYNTGITFNDYEGNPRWNLSYRGLNAADKDFYIYRYTDDNSYHVAMSLIRSNGNVGIGTNGPSYKLDVNGVLRATAAMFGGDSGINIGMTYKNDTTGAYDLIERKLSGSMLYLQYNHNGGINLCQGGGNVGIGTTNPQYKLDIVGNTMLTGGWYRSKGAYGWYSEDYAGGWYMADAAWIRNYNSKPLLLEVGTNNTNGIGGHRVGLTLRGSSHCSIMMIGTNGGTGYGWGIAANADGNFYVGRRTGESAGYSSTTDSYKFRLDGSGNGLFYGGVTMYSDQRKKTILNHVELSLKQIADAPLIEHYYNSDESKTTHVGSIAQYWAKMNDWFCKLDSEGFYTMEIQNAALASAISIARELDRYETKTDKDIKKLKKRICELEEEVERLKSA